MQYQKEDNALKPVLYFSRQTSKEEQRYHSYELETLAVVNSLQRFRIYLIGIEFKVITDCNALRTTLNKRDLIPRIGRWWMVAQEFDFEVVYRPGQKMAHVDALSRNAVEPVDDDKEMQVLTVNVNEDDWILSIQLEDSRCKYLSDILSQDPQDKEEELIHKEYVKKDGKVYRKTPLGKRWVVPKTARREVVMCHHDRLGHFALEKTLESVSKRYWFANMRKYIKQYIARCLPCCYNKEKTGKKQGFLHPIPKGTVPMQTLHVDHLGPFVRSSRRNAYLITAIDAFTKFIFMKAVASTKVGPAITFLQEIIDLFGVPSRLVCDRGSCYTSKRFTEFCQQIGMKVIKNATATPRANGQMERYNRVILSALSCSTEQENKWDEKVNTIRFSINSTINASTGKSPYELLLGFTPRGASDAYILNTLNIEDEVHDLKRVRAEAAERIHENQKRQKLSYDKKRSSPTTYVVGQQVVVRKVRATNDGKSKKLLPKYSGPYVISKVLPHDRYIINDLPGARRAQKAYEGICSVDKLKPFTTKINDDDILSSDDEI